MKVKKTISNDNKNLNPTFYINCIAALVSSGFATLSAFTSSVAGLATAVGTLPLAAAPITTASSFSGFLPLAIAVLGGFWLLSSLWGSGNNHPHNYNHEGVNDNYDYGFFGQRPTHVHHNQPHIAHPYQGNEHHIGRHHPGNEYHIGGARGNGHHVDHNNHHPEDGHRMRGHRY